MGVGAQQQFARPTGGGGVNGARNGLRLDGTDTVMGDPLDQNTLIAGAFFDLVFGNAASPINNFGIVPQLFTIDNTGLAGGEVSSFTDLLTNETTISDGTTTSIHRHINSRIEWEGTGSNGDPGLTRWTPFQQEWLFQSLGTGNQAFAQINPFVTVFANNGPSGGISQQLSPSSMTINASDGVNLATHGFTGSTLSWQLIGGGGQTAVWDVDNFGFDYTFTNQFAGNQYRMNFDPFGDAFDIDFGDTKRGMHWQPGGTMIWESFDNTTTQSSQVQINPGIVRLYRGDGTDGSDVIVTPAGVIIQGVNAGQTTSFSVNPVGPSVFSSDLGQTIQDAADYSSTYTPLSHANVNYVDTTFNGQTFTNAPSNGDVAVFNGVNWTFQAPTATTDADNLKFFRAGIMPAAPTVTPFNPSATLASGWHYDVNDPAGITLTGVKIHVGSAATAAASQVDIQVRSYTPNNALQYVPGAGALVASVATFVSGGAVAATFDNPDSVVIAPVVLPQGTTIYVDVDPDLWSLTDVEIELITQ